MNITVLGAGAWGTALAKLLRESGNEVALWGHDPTHLADVRSSGRNERYLPGVPLPSGLHCEDNLAEALRGTSEVIVAVPSRAFREVARALAVCMELQSDAGSYRDVDGRIQRLSKVQAGS